MVKIASVKNLLFQTEINNLKILKDREFTKFTVFNSFKITTFLIHFLT